MNKIELYIKALSPLAIGRHKPGGSVSEVEEYIPGTVIRGAIAAQILRESGLGLEDFATQDDDFQFLFLSENPAVFQNAYPAIITVNEKPKDISSQAEIACLPATALSSKTNPGFKTKEGGDGAFDTLIDRFCADCHSHPYDPCMLKGDRVDVFSSLYCKINDRYYAPSTSKRLLTRVGINRRRATAEDEILYSLEVLNESKQHKEQPVVYRSAVLVPNSELANILQQYISDRSTSFRFGGSTSRGLGAVEITAKSPVSATSNVQKRVNQFNHSLKQRWKDWKVFGIPLIDQIGDYTFFTLNLQSDAILSENWQHAMVISVCMLKHFTGIEDQSLQIHATYSSYDYRSGWNSAWGLMKDVELVTNKGAVYLFSTTQPNLWIEKLVELELKGVGDRTNEGFGQIRVCDEFHLVFWENAA